jgi:hypothetical protein
MNRDKLIDRLAWKTKLGKANCREIVREIERAGFCIVHPML